jgi:rhodanese-related sulfurtransferase
MIIRKPFRINRILLLATIIILLAGLQSIPRDKNAYSCSPACKSLLGKSAPGEVLAANFQPQKEPPASVTKPIEATPAKKQLIHPEVLRIPAKEVKELLAKKAPIVIVDVNPADHYELWHIPAAINIPFASREGSSDKESMLAQLPKDKLIVLYCLCEEGADSSEMALLLRQMNYRRDMVKVLEGGLIKWDEKGYPIFKKEVPE